VVARWKHANSWVLESFDPSDIDNDDPAFRGVVASLTSLVQEAQIASLRYASSLLVQESAEQDDIQHSLQWLRAASTLLETADKLDD